LRAQPAQDCAERDPAPVAVGVLVVPGRQAAPLLEVVEEPFAAPGSRSAAGHTSGRPHPAPGSPGPRGACPARRPRRGPSSTTRPVTASPRPRAHPRVPATSSGSGPTSRPGRTGRAASTMPADPATPPRSDTGPRSPRRPDGDHATDATDPTPLASTGRSQPTARPTTLGHDPRTETMPDTTGATWETRPRFPWWLGS
jgi:hypothetical protein